MKKRIFALVLSLLMVAVLVPMVLAADEPPHEVVVNGAIEAVKEDSTTWASSVVMETADMAKTVDFRCVLRVVTIKNTITAWYNRGVSLINDIAGDDDVLRDTLMGHFDTFPVTGEFTVTVDLSGAPKLHVPAKYTDTTDAEYEPMIGFNDVAKALFVETGRTLSGTTLTINIAIKANLSERDLYDGIVAGTYFGDDLVFTVEGVTMDTFTSNQKVKGSMLGTTTFQVGNTPSASDSVTFKTQSGLNATLRTKSSATVDTPDDYKITFNIDGNTKEINPIYDRGTIKVSELPAPTKIGYKFDGWYFDSKKGEKVTEDFKLTKNITLYGHWVSDVVDTENHYAYVIGYPDGTVRAEQNITREEVAMIFYRLLRDDVRAELRTDKNDFTDVAADRWSNVAISTMVNGGFIVGYPDGTFGPERNITRAEFATIATRFASLMDDSGATFSDIDGHWSKSYVLKAATAGWISGYPDGTFLPEKNITRAEAFTIINNVLSRSVNKEGLHADTTLWSDMDGSEWYYYIVLEATNSHSYARQEDGIHEDWSAIIENKTWD